MILPGFFFPGKQVSISVGISSQYLKITIKQLRFEFALLYFNLNVSKNYTDLHKFIHKWHNTKHITKDYTQKQNEFALLNDCYPMSCGKGISKLNFKSFAQYCKTWPIPEIPEFPGSSQTNLKLHSICSFLLTDFL